MNNANSIHAALKVCEAFEAENSALRAEVARLAKSNQDLCDEVWELRQRLNAMSDDTFADDEAEVEP